MAEAKTNAIRMLESAHIAHEARAYACKEPLDAVTVAKLLGADAAEVYKTLVTQGKGGGYFVFVIPAAAELDLKKAARAAGEKAVTMIPVKDITRVTGYVRGGCSPIGMKRQYPTFLHELARSRAAIYVSAGHLGQQVFLNPDDLCALICARYADLLP